MIFRGGLVANDNDGIPLLINNKGEGYRVNGTAVSLWKMCNGTTFQQVLDEVIRISNHDESKVKSLLEMLSQQKKDFYNTIRKSKRKFSFILLILSYAIFFNSFIQGLA